MHETAAYNLTQWALIGAMVGLSGAILSRKWRGSVEE